MYFRVPGCLFLIFIGFTLPGQNQGSQPSTSPSRIVLSRDGQTREPYIEMRDALYDAQRKNLPYFPLTLSTDENTIAVPDLIVKKTIPVDARYASVIRKQYADYLTGNFPITEKSGTSRSQRVNQYRLFPFRLNASNQVEELVDYEVTWEKKASPTAGARSSSSTPPFASNSVLEHGTWYKIAVTNTGIYKLTRTFFSSMGVNPANIDTKKIRIYGNGGKMLPELNSAPRVDDLYENPILVVDGGDGVFDAQDYILFFGSGPDEFRRKKTGPLKFEAVKNLYSDTSYYFVNFDLGVGKRLGVQPSGSNPNVSTNTYDEAGFHEVDLVWLAQSGRQALGESFDFVTSYFFKVPTGDFVVGDSLVVECQMAAAGPPGSDSTRFSVTGNGLSMNIGIPALYGGEHDEFAKRATKTGVAMNTNASDITLVITKNTPTSVGWLDKFTVNARRSLVVPGKQMTFRDTRVSSPGKVAQFFISSALPQGIQLWNVTDPLNPYIQAYNLQSNGLDFVANADSVNEYCAAPPSDFYTPTFVGKVANQNLHAITQAHFVIIAHPMFAAQARRLGIFHQQREGYTYCVATTEQIYNEFSSGRPDASAIRDFIRMIYSRNASNDVRGQQVRFACLMGDGSYNNRSRNLLNNSNLIPTYQSINSLDPLYSVATDDFYAMMDPDEGQMAESTGLVDIGMGRFTCRTVDEVEGVLGKIEHYYSKDPNFRIEQSTPISHSNSQSPLGDWRTWLLFLADDLDNATHMKQSEGLSQIVEQVAPMYNMDKIMLDAYQRVSTPGGNRYPDAQDDFVRRIKKGCLFFNYTGHGGEVGLTAERLVDVEMINNFDNINNLPLFITATCEFTRYDDPQRTSAGELSLLNPKGAAISLLTTCRLAFSSYNETLNRRLIRAIYEKLPTGQWPTLGDITRITKSTLGSQEFYANFHLIGDPALTLAYPEMTVATTAINGNPANSGAADTIKSLSKVTIEGIVTDLNGNKLDFNGVVYPSVFDKIQLGKGLLNDVGSAANGLCDTCTPRPFVFPVQKNILYRGKAHVQHGNFKFTFIAPKDISFAPGQGKITYYATDGTMDAAGHYTNVIVGGATDKVLTDNTGPRINLFMNDKNFVNGGITDENPILYADLLDSSGINNSGIGLGHDISVILDANSANPLVLNDYYEADLDSYQSGRVRYPFSKLKQGNHELNFKVWDIQNNSSVLALDFVVAERAELALKQVLNYPNPFTSHTKFFFEHNQSGVPLKVHIQVFTVSGKMVKTITQTVVSDSFISSGIDWDGRDDFGDKLARGVYIYRLSILDINNKKAEKIEKLVILN